MSLTAEMARQTPAQLPERRVSAMLAPISDQESRVRCFRSAWGEHGSYVVSCDPRERCHSLLKVDSGAHRPQAWRSHGLHGSGSHESWKALLVYVSIRGRQHAFRG